MIRVAVDAMGGDRGAHAVIEGALAAASDEIAPVIFGSPDLDTRGLPFVPTTQVVGMREKPADALRTKDDSSLVRAVKAVADGEADAVVSPGNTGAMLAAGLVLLRRVPRGRRPPIAPPLPAPPGAPRLLAARADAHCPPQHPRPFSAMGAGLADGIL